MSQINEEEYELSEEMSSERKRQHVEDRLRLGIDYYIPKEVSDNFSDLSSLKCEDYEDLNDD